MAQSCMSGHASFLYKSMCSFMLSDCLLGVYWSWCCYDKLLSIALHCELAQISSCMYVKFYLFSHLFGFVTCPLGSVGSKLKYSSDSWTATKKGCCQNKISCMVPTIKIYLHFFKLPVFQKKKSIDQYFREACGRRITATKNTCFFTEVWKSFAKRPFMSDNMRLFQTLICLHFFHMSWPFIVYSTWEEEAI